MGEMLPRYTAGTYNLFNTNVMIREGAGAEFYRSYCMGGKTGTSRTGPTWWPGTTRTARATSRWC